MNKIRDAFVRNLLQVYYGAPVKSLKSRPCLDREGLYGLFLQVQFKNRVKETLLLKQMSAEKAQMILERENTPQDPFLPEPLFHLQMITKEHLFLQRLAGMLCDEESADLTDKQVMDLLDHLELLSRRSSAPLEYGKAFDHEEAAVLQASADVEASLALTPETWGVINGVPLLWDSSLLAFHHSGYALWHLILEQEVSPERAETLFDSFYEQRGIPGPQAAACRRLAREECLSDRRMTEKEKSRCRECYGGE